MSNTDNLCVSALRVVGAETISKAKSGHPGIVLGAAPILHVLFTRHLNINPQEPKWINRDRFVLSAGHGSALLYEMLCLSGFGLTTEDLKQFRQKGSLTPGHPEVGHTAGVEMTGGPLGQGLSTAVGMAIGEKFLAAKFNKEGTPIIDHYTYVLCGDGDLQEGVTMEALSLAGHLNLNKLIVLYDSNGIQLDGETALANSENFKQKVEAMNWNHILVTDGNDFDMIDAAIEKAKSSNKPTVIECKTIIGYGAPNSGESSVHGKPLSDDDLQALRKNLSYTYPPFEYPDEVKRFYNENVIERGILACNNWNKMLSLYAKSYPNEYKEFSHVLFDDYELNDLSDIPTFAVGSKESTRKESGIMMNWVSSKLSNVLGGSADLSSSTMIKGADGIFGESNPIGRNIMYGVREHAMGAIVNGITLYGGLRGFGSGFFVFSDYLRPAIRLAAIMSIPSLFIFSHDSICVGEDGPTHEPVEQLTSFRCMPNVNVIRPADGAETQGAFLEAFKHNTYPTLITTSRQPLFNSEYTSRDGVAKGAYIAYEANKNAKYAIISCGAELYTCIEVAKELHEQGLDINVVSMPSMFLFERQSDEYKKQILPEGQTRLAVEMGSTMSWYKYAKYVYGIDRFGASMNINDIIETFGYTKDQIKEEVLKLFK